MKTSGGLLVLIAAVALMAPPAYPQKTQDQLNQIMVDFINMKNAFDQFQKSTDQKNADIKSMLEQIQGRFNNIDAGFIRLGDMVSSIKANDDKTATELQSVRSAVNGLKDNFAPINEGLTSLQNQVRGLDRTVKDMQTQEAPAAAPTVSGTSSFNEAFLSYSQGLTSISISGFQDFLKNFPTDERAALAHIYIGEAFRRDKKYDQAITEFDIASQNYPSSDKRCTALLKKGQTYVESKETPKAKLALEAVVKECPSTDEAKLASEDLKKPPFTRARD